MHSSSEDFAAQLRNPFRLNRERRFTGTTRNLPERDFRGLCWWEGDFAIGIGFSKRYGVREDLFVEGYAPANGPVSIPSERPHGSCLRGAENGPVGL